MKAIIKILTVDQQAKMFRGHRIAMESKAQFDGPTDKISAVILFSPEKAGMVSIPSLWRRTDRSGAGDNKDGGGSDGKR